jgi:hypothetical protein
MTKFLISYLWEEIPKYDKVIIKHKESVIEYYYEGKVVSKESIVVGQKVFYPKNLNVVVIDALDKKDALIMLYKKFQYNIIMTYVEELDRVYEYGGLYKYEES